MLIKDSASNIKSNLSDLNWFFKILDGKNLFMRQYYNDTFDSEIYKAKRYMNPASYITWYGHKFSQCNTDIITLNNLIDIYYKSNDMKLFGNYLTNLKNELSPLIPERTQNKIHDLGSAQRLMGSMNEISVDTFNKFSEELDISNPNKNEDGN